MALLSNLMVRIGVDDSRVGRGVSRASQQFSRFGENAERVGRQIGDAGETAGRNFGNGFTRDANGRLHDTFGRFVRESGPAGSEMGTSLAKGAGGSFGPLLAVKIAAGLSLLPALGAIAATGLVLAFGGAFAAIGMLAAKSNKGVQKQMSSLSKHVSSTMRRISKPFVTVWETQLRKARRTFDLFAGGLEKGFKVIAPSLNRFLSWLQMGFQKLAPAIEPLSIAFSKLVDAIGPSLPGIFEGISDALIQIADMVAENPDLFAGFVTGLLKLLPLTLKLVGALGELFVWVSKVVGTTNPWITTLTLLATPLIILIAIWRQFKSTLDQAMPAIEGIWNKIKTTFDQVMAFLAPKIALITGVISAGFGLIRAIVSGIFNLIKAIIFGDFEQVKATFAAAMMNIQAAWSRFWDAVKTLAAAVWSGIKTVVSNGINWVKSSISSGINAAKSIFSRGWNGMKSAASSGVSRVVSVARSLPGRILRAVGTLGGLLVNAGRNVIQGLISGIRSMIPSVGNAMSGIAGKIRGFLPFSPAKEGPLSGRGNPEVSGMKIASMLANGMAAGTRDVASAAGLMTAATGVGAGSVGTPSGVRAAGRNGNAPVVVIKSGGSQLDDLLVSLLQRYIANNGGDVQVVLGR